MKFVFFVIIALIAGAKCQHGHEITAPKTLKNTPMDDVNDSLKYIKHFKYWWHTLHVNMIDKQCVVDKYTELNLLAYIPSEVNENFPKQIRSSRYLALNMFVVVVTRCIKQYDAIMDYFYENLMTTHILYNALKDEPEFKTYSDMIMCANYHAETKNISEVHTYNLKYKMDNKTQTQCDGWIAEFKVFRKEVTDNFCGTDGTIDVRCFYTFFDSFEKLALKHVLLMQVELTTEQRKETRIRFKKNWSTLMDSALVCGGKVLPEVLRITRDGTTSGGTHKTRFSFFDSTKVLHPSYHHDNGPLPPPQYVYPPLLSSHPNRL